MKPQLGITKEKYYVKCNRYHMKGHTAFDRSAHCVFCITCPSAALLCFSQFQVSLYKAVSVLKVESWCCLWNQQQNTSSAEVLLSRYVLLCIVFQNFSVFELREARNHTQFNITFTAQICSPVSFSQGIG
jgi:hypothetical protein